MDWLETFRDPEMANRLLARIKEIDLPEVRFMEVCGTHTVAICRHGIRELLPSNITLTSGPGCPVCVTSTADIDRFVKGAGIAGAIITTFGDLLRVPGSRTSLQDTRIDGSDIRPVYSSLDALDIARNNPDREVIFLGVGFETTTPTVAAAILTAAQEGLKNFSVISSHKIIPPALEALLNDPAIRIDGLLCPGHVSVMIGARAYRPLAARYKVPCVVAGFEPVDILQGVALLALQIAENRAEVEVAYNRAVTEKGNKKAMAIMDQVFRPTDAMWRGLGVIPGTGLEIKEEYEKFDATKRFDLEVEEAGDPAGCACGEVLKSIISPAECKLFGKVCRPEKPVGPCMVSSEGSCGAYYRYQGGIK